MTTIGIRTPRRISSPTSNTFLRSSSSFKYWNRRWMSLKFWSNPSIDMFKGQLQRHLWCWWRVEMPQNGNGSVGAKLNKRSVRWRVKCLWTFPFGWRPKDKEKRRNIRKSPSAAERNCGRNRWSHPVGKKRPIKSAGISENKNPIRRPVHSNVPAIWQGPLLVFDAKYRSLQPPVFLPFRPVYCLSFDDHRVSLCPSSSTHLQLTLNEWTWENGRVTERPFKRKNRGVVRSQIRCTDFKSSKNPRVY